MSKLKPPRLLTRGIECLVSPWDLPPSQWHDIYKVVISTGWMYIATRQMYVATGWVYVATRQLYDLMSDKYITQPIA